LERVDDKGKVFTERVRKSNVEVDIVTIQGRLHGYMHVRPGQRVKDMLNNPAEQFLAITNATTTRNGETEIQHAGFLAVNKMHVISVIPIDEPKLADEDPYWP
jgi:hypothetical protein